MLNQRPSSVNCTELAELVNRLDQNLAEIGVLTRALGLARQPATIGILSFGEADLVVLVAIISAKISQTREWADMLFAQKMESQHGAESPHAG